MKWFKFYGQDYLSDPKMLSLSASERSCWITLLCYSSVNDNGMITFISEEQLMLQAGLWVTSDEWDKTLGVLKKFEKLGMITLDNDKITIINWEKRQETNLTSYERVKRFRQKKRNDNAMITIEENRIEENRINKEDNVAVATIEEISEFDIFWKEYPKKEKKRQSKEIWDRKKINRFFKEIMSFISKAKETDRWKGGFIKQPTTFLCGECWNDDISAYNNQKAPQLQSLDLRKK